MCIEVARTAKQPAETRATAANARQPTKRARRTKREPVRPAPLPEPAPPPLYARDLPAFLRAFEDTSLAREEWTHGARLVVALAYAREDPALALARLRAAIQRYDRATVGPPTRAHGFHETITRAWLHLVVHFLDLFDDGRPLPELAAELVTLYGSEELFGHYSRGRLLSLEARARWVEPDLAPLPPLEPLTVADRRWLAALAPAPAPAPARSADAAALVRAA